MWCALHVSGAARAACCQVECDTLMSVFRAWFARPLAWLNRCRAILVRYAKKSSNYLGLIMIACILLWYRRAHRLGVLR